jgi:hypothetical protein
MKPATNPHIKAKNNHVIHLNIFFKVDMRILKGNNKHRVLLSKRIFSL